MDIIDKKARKILFDTFWGKNGWIDFGKGNGRTIRAEDFEYAKAQGVMFDPLTISHDALIARIVGLATQVSKEKAARAFLASLSSRRLDWRSAIASWHAAKQLSIHSYKEHIRVSSYSYNNGVMTPIPIRECEICAGKEIYREIDLNVLNFGRIRWGGTPLGDLIYTLLDLDELSKANIPEPSSEDIGIFKAILNTAATSEKTDAPGALRDRIKDIFPSNKDERGVLLEILAYIDVLQAARDDRPGPRPGGRNDWQFIVYWRGEDKYNEAAIEQIFGKWLPLHSS